MRSIGIDLHKTYAYVVELSHDGDKKHYRVALTDDELPPFFDTLDEDAQVVVEASTSSFRFSELVAGRAGRVVVSDPAQTRGALSQAAVNDHKAAETLARLLQSNFVREVWVPHGLGHAANRGNAYQGKDRSRPAHHTLRQRRGDEVHAGGEPACSTGCREELQPAPR